MDIHVAGPGVAELPVPLLIRALLFASSAGVFALVAAGAFFLADWGWLELGFTRGAALVAAACSVTGIAAAIVFARSGRVRAVFGLKRAKTAPDKWRFAGFRSRAAAIAPVLLCACLFGAAAALAARSLARCPLPARLVSFDVRTGFARPKGALPVFLWDYSTWIEPEWIAAREIHLPYEKGLPQKLLPRIHFRDPVTKALHLELHGRRPRAYPPEQVSSLFATLAPQSSVFSRPGLLPLLYRLGKEAGLAAEGTERPDELFFLRFENGTRLLGVPWNELLTGSPKRMSGRFFYWGPDGSVFQGRCPESIEGERPSPCAAAALLSRVEFPPDPRGSLAERRKWTGERLREHLAALQSAPASAERERLERVLSLYLVSYLTLDPRDAEAFFHLGKLSRGRDTVEAIVRYGHDVGMDAAQIAELNSALPGR